MKGWGKQTLKSQAKRNYVKYSIALYKLYIIWSPKLRNFSQGPSIYVLHWFPNLSVGWYRCTNHHEVGFYKRLQLTVKNVLQAGPSTWFHWCKVLKPHYGSTTTLGSRRQGTMQMNTYQSLPGRLIYTKKTPPRPLESNLLPSNRRLSTSKVFKSKAISLITRTWSHKNSCLQWVIWSQTNALLYSRSP